jgi:hypothetical protein
LPTLLRILILVPLGYVAACLAAGLMVALRLYDIGSADFAMDGFGVGFTLILATYFGAVTAVPALIAIMLAEALGWRSFFFWSPLGGAIAFVGEMVMARGGALASRELTLVVAAGLVAGAVYWLIAGRKSGLAAARP